MAQPKHQLTPQQLQMLADGTGTLEGLAVGSHLPLPGGTKPIVTQEGMQSGLQGSSTQPRHQGPLGIATVVLDGEKNSQQFASLFTPRHDQAGMTLRQTADVRPDVQGMFSSASQEEPTTTEKARVRSSAKSLQGVYLDQPEAHKAGFPALEGAAAGRQQVFTNPDSLRWLDEVAADRAERAAQHLKDLQQKEQNAATKGPWQLQREKEQLDGQLHMDKGSLLEAERQPAADVQRPSLSKAVLLTLIVNIAAKDTEVNVCSAVWQSLQWVQLSRASLPFNSNQPDLANPSPMGRSLSFPKAPPIKMQLLGTSSCMHAQEHLTQHDWHNPSQT